MTIYEWVQEYMKLAKGQHPPHTVGDMMHTFNKYKENKYKENQKRVGIPMKYSNDVQEDSARLAPLYEVGAYF